MVLGGDECGGFLALLIQPINYVRIALRINKMLEEICLKTAPSECNPGKV